MRLSIISLLLFGCFQAVESQCSTGETQEAIQCTFLNVASSKNGASCLATVDGSNISCPYLIDEDLADGNKNSTSEVKIDFARSYLIDTIRITESDQGAESQLIKLTFSDGSTEQITLSAGFYGPEEISFAARTVSWVKLVLNTKYEDGITLYTEVQIYYDGCQQDKICDYFELNSVNTSTPGHILGQTLSFIRNAVSGMDLELTSVDKTVTYKLRLAEKVSLLDSTSNVVAGPTDIPGLTGDPFWLPFWVDLRNAESIIAGVGASVLIDYNTGGGKALVHGKFALQNPGQSSEKLIFCNRKDSCYSDATHYLPLDKLVTKMAYDVNYKSYGTEHGAIVMDYDGPPMAYGKQTSVMLQDDYIDLDCGTSCVTNLELCTKGLSISLWLKIESLPASVGYYLTGGSLSSGFAIFAPLEQERTVADNALEIEFQITLRRWQVSVPVSLGDWHHIGCAWQASEGLYCIFDMSTELTVIETLPKSTFGALTLGKSAIVPKSYGHASFSDLAIWEKKLTKSDFQNLFPCMGFKPGIFDNATAANRYRLSDDSFSASTFTEDGAPYFARPTLGGWRTQESDSNQYLQIDFFALMEIHALEIKGNSAINAFVEKFTLSQSKSTATWTTYKDGTGNTKLFTGNSDSSTAVKINLDTYIVTRYLRINPVTFNGNISLTIAIFGKQMDANYEGCFPAGTVPTSEPLLESVSTPYDCSLVCGQHRKPHALLHNGGDCYCVGSINVASSVGDEYCQKPCSKRKAFACGGQTNVAAFSVMEHTEKKFEIVAPMWTKEKETFNLAMHSTGSSPFLVYKENLVSTTNNTNLPLSFLQTGMKSFAVETTLGQYNPETIQLKHSIFVAMKTQDLELTCPKLVVSFQTYKCLLKGYADEDVPFDYKINNVLVNRPSLPATFTGIIGGLDHPVEKTDDTQKGLLFISSFPETVVVSGIELHAQKSGYLTIQIFRPVCGEGSFRQYCNITNQCTYYHPICSDITGYACSGGKPLHLANGLCLEHSNCTGKASMPGFIPTKYTRYEVIYQNQVFVDYGMNKYGLGDKERVSVRQNDVIGVSYPSDNAATLSIEDVDGYEAAVANYDSSGIALGGYIEASDNVKIIHLRHSVRARYFVPANMTLALSLPPGVHQVTADFRNQFDDIRLSQTIVSCSPIEGLSWTLKSIMATHDIKTITAQVTMGTNVTYIVDYGDGTIQEVFHENTTNTPITFTHAYTTPGYKFIQLRAFNLFSDEVSSYTLLVQDYIKDVNLSSPVKPTNFTDITAIDWYIDSGSRVTIEIDIGDGTTFLNESLDINGILARPIRHVYPSPTEFWVNITAYNLVNKIELYFMLIIEIPIVQLKSRVIHANRDIEVNETVLIELSQLNGTNVIHHFQFQDTSTLLTRETNIYKNYSYWAVFPVNITAWNNVSWVTWTQEIKVHKPVIELTGFVITTSPTNHTDPVAFDFDMTTGSDFNCTWNFDDNLYGETAYWILDSEVYKWPTTHQVKYHQYAGIGVYNVRINCSNRLYETSASTISIVQVPISNFDVVQPPPQPNDEDLVVDFSAATGTNISYTVTFYHIWDKNEIPITNVTIVPSTLSGRAVISKEYFTNRVALYEVRVTAINLVTPLQVITRRVIVDRPIRNPVIVIHALYVETNHTVNYSIHADASNVTITWNFDDPGAGDRNIHTEWFQGVYSIDGWIVWHKFKQNGFYMLKVTLTNSLGSVNVTKQVIAQHGVYLILHTDSPRPLPPGRMNFTFEHLPKKAHPTDAQMVVEFGDGRKYNGSYNATTIHFYESWGWFSGNVTIGNEISWGFFTFRVEIQRTIQGLKLTPFHSAGDAGFFGPGRGPDLDRLPLEYDVIWNVTADDGTNITYTFDFGDSEGEHTKNATVLHKYPRVDFFTASVFAENSVSSGSASFTIRIQQIVRGLNLESDCPRKLADTTRFTITIDQIGTESCYLLKFGNNSKNYLYKDHENTLCEETFTTLADKTMILPGHTFNQTYVYDFIDVYWPRLIGSNLVSKTWKFHKAVVVHDHCRYPDVDVFNIGKNTTYAPDVLRSQLFMVDTQNVIICDASKTTSFIWEVFTVNSVEGGNDTEHTLPTTIVTTNPRLRIDPRTLPYGLYKMRFTITMLGIRGVVGHDDAYLRIVESPMIAVVEGGSGVAKGIDQNVTLDASGSQDPDVGPNIYDNITITWECQVVKGVANKSQEEAGCAVDQRKVLVRGDAADLVYLNTDFAKLPNSVYSVKLRVRKNHRSTFTYFNIYTQPMDVLPVSVRCLINCKKKRITAMKMVYEGGIKGMTDPNDMKMVEYEWKLYKAKETGRGNRINEDNWKEIEEFSEMVATTIDKNTVVISEKMLWPEYRYRLRLYVKFEGQEGFAEDELYINQPPGGGNCSIEPPEGYALETPFFIKCWGWEDNDMPLAYKFSYKTREEDFDSLIYFGSKSVTPPVKLPLGKPAWNYSVSVIINTIDSFLAPFMTKLNVTVVPKPIADQEQFQREMMNLVSPNGSLGNMMASGDAHSAAQLVSSMSSLLDDQATGNTTNDEPEEDIELTDVKAMTPEEREELEKLKEEKRKQKEEAEKKARQARTELRKTMLNSFQQVAVDSIESAMEKSAAQAALTNTPDEVTEDMQNSMLNTAQEMAYFMMNSTEESNPADRINALGGLAGMAGNTIEASINTGAEFNSSAEDEGNSTKKDSPSRGMVYGVMDNIRNVGDLALSGTFAGEPPIELNTDRLTMAVQRVDPSSFGNGSSSTGGGSFKMPDAGTVFGIEGNDTSGMPAVDMKSVSNNKNPFAWDASSSKIKSKVMTMELKNATGHPIKVSNLSKPIDMWVPRGSSVEFSNYTMTHGSMLYRAFTVVENDTSIQVEILPEDTNTELIAYIRAGKFPSKDLHDFAFEVPRRVYPVEDNSTANKTNTREANPYIFFVSNEDLNRTAAGKYYIGIKYNGTFDPEYEPSVPGSKAPPRIYVPPLCNFTMRTFTSSCMYWNEDNDTWSTDGCTVGPKTAMEGTQCLCTHLTSFGGDMVVAPNVIDWSAISLDNLFSNPVVFIVVVSFIALYFILLIPARRQDKKDLEKLGVVPLPDNDPRDNYSYEITVYTGFTAEAGTTAQVYFILAGTRDETPVRLLKDPEKEKISVGSIKYFLLTVPSSLGKLKSLRIWHDNGGSSPSWYLLRIMIHDLQRDTKTWFLCDRWLAVEEDDGEIERRLRPAGAEDLTKFNLLFQTEARKNLSDGHIWFSVLKRPARSNFTRVQRLSCCLCILLTTMLANAMFYQNDPSKSGDGVLVLGPITLSLQQLSIAVTSSMVVLPVNLFVVWIFRNTRPKKTSKDKKPKKRQADLNGKQSTNGKEKDGKKKTSLPHWMTYIAYFLIFIACSVSGAFTVFYGLTFGKAKSEAWISAMMLSFWQDVLVSQPLKVFAAATVFAMLTKDPKKATGEDEEDTLPSPELQEDEEFTSKRHESAGLVSLVRIDPKPPDPQKLQASRELKLKQKQMKYILYDIIWYFIFVSVLLSVAYGNKDPSAYQTTSTMAELFEESSYTDWIPLSEVDDAKLYWYWSRYSLLPTLIPNQWYGPNLILENVVWTTSDSQISRSRGARSRMQLSQQKQRKLQGRPGQFPDISFALNGTANYPEHFVADRATDYTVGVARFRQLRVKPNQCKMHPSFQHLFSECNSFYSWEKEDEGQYLTGWSPNNKTSNVNNTDDGETTKQKGAWEYNTAWELKGTPYWATFSTYWGGGFVADMGHNESIAMNMTKYLQESNWLDRYTRAIFTEFTTYNPNTNMFCLVTLLTEIIPTGGYYQFNQIYPMRLYRYYGSNLLAIMVLEITLMTFLVYFAYREFKKWRRDGRLYWRQGWNYMELLVLAACFSTIGLYFARMVATNYSINLMREDPTSFVSFHYASALDQWATVTLGLGVFLSFLKTLSLLRFNRRVAFIGASLKLCAKPLASFSIVYMVVFIAYAGFGFLAFGRVCIDYHTFHASMANVLGMTLGAFNFEALVEADSFLGPTFFFTFTFVVNMILINVFLAIICESLAAVTSDAANQSNEHEMLDFMVEQFKAFVGKRVSPAIKPIYKEPLPELEAKFDQIEKKSESVETALRNMCMEEIRLARWFDPESCPLKKKLLVRLLMHAEEDLTESDICDAIPLLDEVLVAYTEKDMKEWLGEFGEYDETKSCSSSILFSRASLIDSDDESIEGDDDSDNESLREGRWSELSGETTGSRFFENSDYLPEYDSRYESSTPGTRSGTAECFYREHERPPSTAERFCRTETTISMTSLNENMATVDQLLLDENCERLFIEDSEEEEQPSGADGQIVVDAGEHSQVKTPSSDQKKGDENEPELHQNVADVKPRDAGRMNAEATRPTPSNTGGQALFQQSTSPRYVQRDEYMTIEDFSD